MTEAGAFTATPVKALEVELYVTSLPLPISAELQRQRGFILVIKGAIASYRPTMQEYLETIKEPRVPAVTSGAQKVTRAVARRRGVEHPTPYPQLHAILVSKCFLLFSLSQPSVVAISVTVRIADLIGRGLAFDQSNRV